MFKKLLDKIFKVSDIEIRDPYTDDAIGKIEEMTGMEFGKIAWIRKDGSSFFAEDIPPILLRDLLGCGWCAYTSQNKD